MTVGEATDALAGVPTERLEAQITELAGHLAAAECRWLGLVGEFDRRKGYEAWGCVSCAYLVELALRSGSAFGARQGAGGPGAGAFRLGAREVRGGPVELLEGAGDHPRGDAGNRGGLGDVGGVVDDGACGTDRACVSAGDRSRAGTAWGARASGAHRGPLFLG